MTYVNITALTFPKSAGPEIERRFAARARMVDTAEGFLEFELLRPVSGEDRYFVMTRWDSREHYEAWAAARPTGKRGRPARRLTAEGPWPPGLPRTAPPREAVGLRTTAAPRLSTAGRPPSCDGLPTAPSADPPRSYD